MWEEVRVVEIGEVMPRGWRDRAFRPEDVSAYREFG